MTCSSSKHRPRAALTRRDMLPPREIDAGSWPGETNSLQFRFVGWRSSTCCGMEWASGIGLLPAAAVYAGWGGGAPGVKCRRAVAVRRDVTNRNRVHDEMGVREAMGPWVCMMADPPEQRQLTPPKNGCGLMAVATR